MSVLPSNYINSRVRVNLATLTIETESSCVPLELAISRNPFPSLRNTPHLEGFINYLAEEQK